MRERALREYCALVEDRSHVVDRDTEIGAVQAGLQHRVDASEIRQQ